MEAERNLGVAPSVVIEREVHEKVAALVDYVHRLQRPSPESIDAAFAIIENDILEIMGIKPRDVELVITVPHGFRAVAAETILLWIRDGTFMPGSGKYEMQRIAIRDVVGGPSQTTFVFSEPHAEVTSSILGNSELIEELASRASSASAFRP